MSAGAVDYSALWAALGTIIVSIIGGGFAMAWRLGGLENRVKDTQDDVHELKGQVRDLDSRIQGRPNRRITDQQGG